MSPSTFQLLLFVGYGALYLGMIAAALVLARKRRKTRWPFKDSDKLVRGPGETLRRQVSSFAERFIFELFGAALATSLGLLAGIELVRLFKLTGVVGWLVFLGTPLVPMILCVLRFVRLVMRRSNLYLGWFGERIAAEKLRPLQLQGYRVFHDVPAEPGKKGFNIDHVAVGPTGVTVVEVKTRRKGNARPGFKDHEVAFDGTKLIWPWGEDRHGIQQALNEADWLRKWIRDRTGLQVPVRAVLTLPGWMVQESPSRELRVVNPSFLPDAVRGRWPAALTPEQVDLIGRQLDDRCRDVEE